MNDNCEANERIPVRKALRLSGFDYSANRCYFLTICTVKRKCILSRIIAGDLICPAYVILSRYGSIVERYIMSSERMNGFTVDNYVIMPNHVHILVRYSGNDGSSRAPTPTNSAIPQYVSALKRLVNREIGTNIWQRGYHDHIIRNEHDYRSVYEYIENNPAHWAEDVYCTTDKIRNED